MGVIQKIKNLFKSKQKTVQSVGGDLTHADQEEVEYEGGGEE